MFTYTKDELKEIQDIIDYYQFEMDKLEKEKDEILRMFENNQLHLEMVCSKELEELKDKIKNSRK